MNNLSNTFPQGTPPPTPHRESEQARGAKRSLASSPADRSKKTKKNIPEQLSSKIMEGFDKLSLPELLQAAKANNNWSQRTVLPAKKAVKSKVKEAAALLVNHIGVGDEGFKETLDREKKNIEKTKKNILAKLQDYHSTEQIAQILDEFWKEIEEIFNSNIEFVNLDNQEYAKLMQTLANGTQSSAFEHFEKVMAVAREISTIIDGKYEKDFELFRKGEAPGAFVDNLYRPFISCIEKLLKLGSWKQAAKSVDTFYETLLVVGDLSDEEVLAQDYLENTYEMTLSLVFNRYAEKYGLAKLEEFAYSVFSVCGGSMEELMEIASEKKDYLMYARAAATLSTRPALVGFNAPSFLRDCSKFCEDNGDLPAALYCLKAIHIPENG